VIERGTAAFWRVNLGLFAAGLATFALLYCVQPLMPLFAVVFHVTPAQSALTLSVTTMPLAIAMLVASGVSEALGRKPVMVASLLASSVLTLLSGLAPGFASLLLLRGLTGLTLSGLPAVAMAYVAEEMHPKAAGLAMGLYIGGSAIGGLSGRLMSGALADLSSWRVSLAAIGAEGLVCGLLLWRGLPASAHFTPRPLHPAALARTYLAHLRRPVLPWLFAEGFLLMGAFVTLYNFIGYRLMAPPYRLSQTSVGLIFCVYIAGAFSSPLMGNLATRIGRRPVLVGNILAMLAGVALTLATPLPVIVAGVALVTAGFFGAHSVASNWVGFRATEARAQASALYLFAYYAGSSVVGYAGGLVFQHHGWIGICLLLGALLVPAMMLPGWLPSRKQGLLF
jgi:YNFM family putative membrane transporter